MSGHSKWAQIKRQKGVTDAKRSAVFTKLSNAVTVAARDGGGDPATNFRLRLAIEQAKAANMPKDNVDRAIGRGTGELAGATLESLRYEAYGPAGAALLIDVTTDNRLRALAAIKSVLNRANAKLAEPGAVSHLFTQRGVMTALGPTPEATELAILDSGAADYVVNPDGVMTVLTEPKELAAVARTLTAAGLTVTDLDLTMEPRVAVSLDATEARSFSSLVQQLEDLDDVVNVYTNFDFSPPC